MCFDDARGSGRCSRSDTGDRTAARFLHVNGGGCHVTPNSRRQAPGPAVAARMDVATADVQTSDTPFPAPRRVPRRGKSATITRCGSLPGSIVDCGEDRTDLCNDQHLDEN